MIIKNWFIDKNFSNRNRSLIETALYNNNYEIVGVSAKAKHIEFRGVNESLKTWVPKSCIIEGQEVEIKSKPATLDAITWRLKVVRFAKDNGLDNVNMTMGNDDLLAWIAAGNLELPKELKL